MDTFVARNGISHVISEVDLFRFDRYESEGSSLFSLGKSVSQQTFEAFYTAFT